MSVGSSSDRKFLAESLVEGSVSAILKIAGTLQALDRPAEGYRKKVTCDYTAAAWRDGTINESECSQLKGVQVWMTIRKPNGWLWMEFWSTFFLTLTFPVCSGWLVWGGLQNARWHHFIIWVSVSSDLIFCPTEKHKLLIGKFILKRVFLDLYW